MSLSGSGKYLAIFLLSGLTGILFAQAPELRISGTFSGPTKSVLTQIEEQYPVNFFYKKDWFAGDELNVTFDKNTLEEAADILISGKPYSYRIINGNLVVFFPRAELAILTGQIPNFSNKKESEEQFTSIGNTSEAGRHKTVTVTGIVTNGESGVPVIGATIQLQNFQQGVITNNQGSYRLMISPGLYTLVVSSVGYETAQFHVKVISSGEFDMELFDKSLRFEDVVIYGQRMDHNVSSHQMSLVELNIREIGQLPSVSGGKDVIKGLTIMPGIKSIGEFSSGINVRGGGEDQNLYLLNSAPLFYTSHVFGLISVINPDAVEKLSLYKGHIPACFGERASSVIDIRSSEIAPGKIRIGGGTGIYDSRLMIKVPVAGEKLWFEIGGRTSYSDWILKKMKQYDLVNSRAGFYDMNGTIHAGLGKSRIMLSGYSSRDQFRFSSDVRYEYASRAGSLNWKYLIGSNLASYLSLAYSDYNVKKEDIGDKLSRIRSGIQYAGLKYRLQYGGFSRHNFDAGFGIVNYRIKPGEIGPITEKIPVKAAKIDTEHGFESALFLNDEFAMNDQLIFNIGLRYSFYASTGPGSVRIYEPGMPRDSSTITGFATYPKGRFIELYHGIEPRLSARLKLSAASSLKMSYNRNYQYISMISSSNVSTPSDIWKLADTYIRPLIANQYAIGYYHNFYNNTIETSVEIYFKRLQNVIDYADDAELEMSSHIETEIVNANGKNYGIEFLLRKNTGRFEGWLSYTYSRSWLKTEGLTATEKVNNNKYYPSSYDRPHDFGVVGNFNLNKRIRFAANFSFSSGRPVTLPENFYYTEWNQVPIFSERNKYRIEPYHRLDLTLNIGESLRVRKRWKGSWTISILNVYGRKNPYTIYYKMEKPDATNDYGQFRLYKLYLIGKPIPTVSYNFVF